MPKEVVGITISSSAERYFDQMGGTCRVCSAYIPRVYPKGAKRKPLTLCYLCTAREHECMGMK